MQIEKLNREEAFRYMGFKGGEISEKVLEITEECEEQLLKAITPRYVYRVFDIEETNEGVSVSGTCLVFKGKDISAHLKGCEQCILMCSTLSADVDKLIRAYETEGMEKALIADSLASAAVEQVCDKAENEIREAMGTGNYTWRFSPGYGDFPLDIQGEFLNAVDAPRRIGVNVTESLILIPRKSVTAVMGVSKNEIPKGRRGCVSCSMKDNCRYRKNCGHCN